MSFASIFSRTSMRVFLAAVSTSVVFLAGCSMQTTASEGNSFVPAATISGRAMGGQQPIPGSTVDLYSVGTTGYGSAGVHLATTVSLADGSFAFNQVTTQAGPSATLNATYGCPTNSTLLYITATGGIPATGTSSNPAIKLLDAVGPCSGTASNFYNLNEVATVVSLAALQQYMNPINETIGAPSAGSNVNRSSAATGIANAFALVGSILNYANGSVNNTYSPTSTVGTIVATPEFAKINTIANILAACVNTNTSSSPTCISLLAAATAPPLALRTATNFPTSYNPTPLAGDTLQAALFMLQNPTDAGTQVTTCNGATATTSNLACLFSLSSAFAPFIGLTGQPTDWTLGVTYASNSTQTVGATTISYLNEPEYLAVDKSGNVWVNNYIVPTGTGLGNGMTELSPQGGILQQVLTGSNLLVGPRIPVIDPAGNVWSPNLGSTTASNAVGYAKTVVEFPVNGTSAAGNLFNVAGGPFALASDGAGNIFVAETTKAVTNTGGGNGTPGADLELIPAGSAAGTTATVISPTGSAYAASVFASIAVDSQFRPWVTSDSTTVSLFVPPSSGTTYSLLTTASGVTDSVGISIDGSDNAWVANYATSAGALDEFSATSTAISPVTGSPFAAGLTKTAYSTLDGAGNVWATSHTASTGPVTETAVTGVPISPVTGYPHTYYYPTGIAVDPSGNVWIGTENNTTTATAAGTTGPGGAGAGGYVTVIIGAAVPVITPIAAGLPLTAGGISLLASPPR